MGAPDAGSKGLHGLLILGERRTVVRNPKSKSELAKRMRVHEKEARRMLDPWHPTRVPTLERTLAVLGRRAEIAVS